jgi:DNA-binding CsgD family transcriptional regulator
MTAFTKESGTRQMRSTDVRIIDVEPSTSPQPRVRALGVKPFCASLRNTRIDSPAAGGVIQEFKTARQMLSREPRLAMRTRVWDIVALVQAWDAHGSLVDPLQADRRRLVVDHDNRPGRQPMPTLSSRERQALSLLALEQTNKQIAFALGITASTVGVLLHRAAKKLNTTTRGELTARAKALAGRARH